MSRTVAHSSPASCGEAARSTRSALRTSMPGAFASNLIADTDPGTALDHARRAAALAPDDDHTRTEAIRLYQQLGRTDLARTLSRRSDP